MQLRAKILFVNDNIREQSKMKNLKEEELKIKEKEFDLDDRCAKLQEYEKIVKQN